MQKIFFYSIVLSLSIIFIQCKSDKKSSEKTSDDNFQIILNEKSDSLSYFLGILWQRSLSTEYKHGKINTNAMIKGFIDFESIPEQLPTLQDLNNYIMQFIAKYMYVQPKYKITEAIDKYDSSKIILRNELDTFSYYLGIKFYKDFRKQDNNLKLNYDAVLSGWEKNLSNPLNGAEFNKINSYIFNHLKSIFPIRNKQFLIENRNKEGVVELPSGLQYKILKKGFGKKPTISDRVKVHYTGRLIDGTVFDSSVQRGQPITFTVTGVISGWTEALQLMPVGSKWELYLPYNLAYGAHGNPPKIPSYATLIFEVELLNIE